MHIENVIVGATAHASLAAPKFEVVIRDFRLEASIVQATVAFAKLTGMTTPQARWFLDRLPQKLAVPASEYFQSVVMTEVEAREAAQILEPYFECSWSQAGEHVLGFGNFPPWHLPTEKMHEPR